MVPISKALATVGGGDTQQITLQIVESRQRFSTQKRHKDQQPGDVLPMELMDTTWMTSAEEACWNP